MSVSRNPSEKMKFYCSAVLNLRHEREYTVSQLAPVKVSIPAPKREPPPVSHAKNNFFLSPSLEENFFFSLSLFRASPYPFSRAPFLSVWINNACMQRLVNNTLFHMTNSFFFFLFLILLHSILDAQFSWTV